MERGRGSQHEGLPPLHLCTLGGFRQMYALGLLFVKLP